VRKSYAVNNTATAAKAGHAVCDRCAVCSPVKNKPLVVTPQFIPEKAVILYRSVLKMRAKINAMVAWEMSVRKKIQLYLATRR